MKNNTSLLGFTLIEVMVTVLIVSILAAVAFPSYQDYVLRSRRAEGKAILLTTQQRLERLNTDLNSYANAIASSVNASGVLATSENGFYQVTSTPASTTATTYALNSIPQGAQANDRCQTLTITETGAKGTSSGLALAQCWP